ncbi:MAG: tetratricopeptide repeat protein [Planctomycetota bacterium]|nr:tetratricopeptide repeat protein [Planctomycetota bacterium]
MPTRTSARLVLALGLALACAGRLGAAETPDKLFEQAEEKYRKGEYEEAVKLYQGLIAKFGADKHAEDARYTTAFILQKKLGKHEEARKAYQDVIDHKVPGPMLANAYYHMAESYEQSERYGLAIKAYEEFLRKFPKNSRVALVSSRVEYLKNKRKYPENERKTEESEKDKRPPQQPRKQGAGPQQQAAPANAKSTDGEADGK